MNQHLQKILDIIQQAEHLTEEEKIALSKAAKTADKELEITVFKLERTEKVKHTTAILLEETIAELEQKRKAVEVQNRELEIEAALERVRAKTMSMQKPSEFVDVINVIGEQFINLGFDFDWVNFSANGLDVSKAIDIWNFVVVPGLYQGATRLVIPFFEHPVFKKAVESVNQYYTSGNNFSVVLLNKNDKDSFLDHLFTNTIYKDLPDEVKTSGYNRDVYLTSNVVLKDTWLSLGRYDAKLLTDEQIAILKRLANAFGQAYSRFLDLQKAEAQARESQIELGLERVRARAMAMQSSNELSELVNTVFKELTKLDFALTWCIINIIDESSMSNTVWAASPDINKAPESYHMKFEDYPFHHAMMKGWKERKAKSVYTLEGNEKRIYDDYLFSETEFKRTPEAAQAASRALEKYVVSFSFSNFGGLQTVGDAPLSDANLDILSRFGKIFDLTYTRFNDLKQAEAQAREAQIELALERVRARTMAMQKSEELKDVIQLVYEQFAHLNINIEHTGFVMDYKARDDYDIWIADQLGVPSHVTIPYFDCVYYNRFNEAKEKGEDFFATNLTFEEKNRFYKKIIEYVPGLPEETKEFLFSIPGLAGSTVLLDNVCLYIENFSGIPYSDEENNTLMRFGKVFQQTYTRFLDLQKAEAQVREAQIELALERVRARTMAMQKSDELSEAAQLLYHEFGTLGLDLFTCGYLFIKEEQNKQTAWVTLPDGTLIPDYIDFPLTGDHVLDNRYKSWKQKEALHRVELRGEENKEHHRFLASKVPVQVANEIFAQIPDRIVVYSANFSAGYLFIIARTPFISETEQTIIRFAKVFEMTYTRFLDLKQAEAQAKEAHIELALERVRAKAMAMQKSEQLAETAKVLFEQFDLLGKIPDRMSIGIINEESKRVELWVTDQDGNKLNHEFFFSIEEPTSIAKIYSAWKEGKDSIIVDLTGQNLHNWLQFVKEEARLPVDEIRIRGRRVQQAAFFSQGFLLFTTHEPIADEIMQLLVRFARVFDHTYTRFRDLLKVEAQAREAQIELGLERVRARAMAMQKSDELAELVDTVFKELTKLHFTLDRCLIIIVDEKSMSANYWMANPELKTPTSYHLEFKDIPFLVGIFNAWKERKPKMVYDLKGDEKSSTVEYIFSKTELKFLPEEVKAGMKNTDRIFLNSSFSNFGGLQADTIEALTEDNLEILYRFSKVFDLTYTRFNDLQKAEAQAREAQIEAGLERVRSRAMAMHKTDELLDAAELVYKELTTLGITSMSINYAFVDDEEKNGHYYSINPVDGKIPLFPFVCPHTETDVMRSILSGWKKQEPFNVIELDEDATVKHQTYIGELVQRVMETHNMPFSIEAFLAISPKKAVIYTFNFSKGYLFIIGGARLTAMQEEMVLRFTKVFEMTYRRFLDLKLAEAQAREATIEAALEKVRGKAMAMRNSDDLSSTASMVFIELRKLGINPIKSGVGIISKKSRKVQFYSATSSSNGDSLSLTGSVVMSGHPEFEKQYESWLKKENYFTVLEGEELKSYYTFLSSGLNIAPELNNQNDEKQYGHWLMFSEGFLFAWSEKEYSETEIKILERFKNIVELTFRRYIELKKSEASARDAIKQAALDRIRADIASMRTISDLDRITPLIWNELTILGIPFNRCGVFIMDDLHELIHTFLSEPDGKAIAAFHIPYDTPGNINQVLNHWQQKENYIDHWDEISFAEFANTLVKQGALASSEQYLQTIPHGGFYLHFLPFLQGMLYVGNSIRLGEEDIKLVQSVTDAFSTAYARYEDFNKLEAAKQQVDKTLVDLKQAQTQLIQSEKMASLGELTAGIAHEIQNPLNFVNNFSEVNKELLAELNEEIEKGNYEEVKIIANDVIGNEEKINHHGKRADAIVKGMLQHSRSSTGAKEPTDINALADEYLRLSYHGLRAKDKSFNAEMKTDFDQNIGKINIVPQDIGRVLLNLYNNAFYAVNEKKKNSPLTPEGGTGNLQSEYKPVIAVSTKIIPPLEGKREAVELTVMDNGNGIPQKVLDKIFQPFFTTKPTGEGTGLGLSLSYDIIKAHGGEIKVETKEGEGTIFVIQLSIS